MTAPAATASRAALPLADDCCAPLLREPLTQAQAADLARVLKALADPTRLRWSRWSPRTRAARRVSAS
jgi:hypothetical protein